MRGRNDDLANCDCGANDSPRHTAWFTVAFGQAHAVSQRIRRWRLAGHRPRAPNETAQTLRLGLSRRVRLVAPPFFQGPR